MDYATPTLIWSIMRENASVLFIRQFQTDPLPAMIIA